MTELPCSVYGSVRFPPAVKTGARQPAVTFSCVYHYIDFFFLFYLVFMLCFTLLCNLQQRSSSTGTASDLGVKNENVWNSRTGSREVGKKLWGIDYYLFFFSPFYTLFFQHADKPAQIVAKDDICPRVCIYVYRYEHANDFIGHGVTPCEKPHD